MIVCVLGVTCKRNKHTTFEIAILIILQREPHWDYNPINPI